MQVLVDLLDQIGRYRQVVFGQVRRDGTGPQMGPLQPWLLGASADGLMRVEHTLGLLDDLRMGF